MKYWFLSSVVAIGFMYNMSCLAQIPFENGRWLLDSLKTLADEGALFSPARVENVLRLRLESSRRETLEQPADCRYYFNTRSEIVITHFSIPIWLRPTTEGVKNMLVPGISINSPAVLGFPKFIYNEKEMRFCDEKRYPGERRQASLVIKDLPAFACFSRDDLLRVFRAQYVHATNGVEKLTYPASKNGQFDTTLQFTFREGAPCALSVEVRQFS